MVASFTCLSRAPRPLCDSTHSQVNAMHKNAQMSTQHWQADSLTKSHRTSRTTYKHTHTYTALSYQSEHSSSHSIVNINSGTKSHDVRSHKHNTAAIQWSSNLFLNYMMKKKKKKNPSLSLLRENSKALDEHAVSKCEYGTIASPSFLKSVPCAPAPPPPSPLYVHLYITLEIYWNYP